MVHFNLQVKNLESPQRLDLFLSAQENFPSRSRLQALLEDGRILLNAKTAKPSARVKNGDTVSGEFPAPSPSRLEPEAIPLSILYEDADLIVVDKPAGLVTHPTPSLFTGTLVNALLYHCQDLSGVGGRIKPGIVHRLDKLTSGVMVAAKNDRAHHGLAAQFKAHTIDRRYLALVHGEMEKLAGRIETVIGRNPAHRLKMTGRVVKGRRAVTNYRVLGRQHGFSLIECRLETGRTHQIRVHLSETNHPVVGDALYGKGRAPAKLTPAQGAALRHLKRQALHAYRLGFVHPRTGETLTFVSPLPPDLRAALAALGLTAGLTLSENSGRVQGQPG